MVSGSAVFLRRFRRVVATVCCCALIWLWPANSDAQQRLTFSPVAPVLDEQGKLVDPIFGDPIESDEDIFDDSAPTLDPPVRQAAHVEEIEMHFGDTFEADGGSYFTTAPADSSWLADEFAFDDPTCPDCGSPNCCEAWSWQLLPNGLMYPSYLAGTKEPRFASTWAHEKDVGWVWDATLGGRVGLLRYGTRSPIDPDGFQLDIEGAGLPRLDLDDNRDLVSSDFRFGIPFTYREGPFAAKFAYYHLSSHLGDEFLETNPTATRINFTRDVLVLGGAFYPIQAIRLYAEAGWAFYTDISEPWEFQFGAEYSPTWPTGLTGAPFFAVNGHLREEVDFGGNVVIQTGWQWRGEDSGHLLRAGLEYYNGKSRQFEFFNDFEEQLGLGIWYDY